MSGSIGDPAGAMSSASSSLNSSSHPAREGDRRPLQVGRVEVDRDRVRVVALHADPSLATDQARGSGRYMAMIARGVDHDVGAVRGLLVDHLLQALGRSVDDPVGRVRLRPPRSARGSGRSRSPAHPPAARPVPTSARSSRARSPRRDRPAGPWSAGRRGGRRRPCGTATPPARSTSGADLPHLRRSTRRGTPSARPGTDPGTCGRGPSKCVPIVNTWSPTRGPVDLGAHDVDDARGLVAGRARVVRGAVLVEVAVSAGERPPLGPLADA